MQLGRGVHIVIGTLYICFFGFSFFPIDKISLSIWRELELGFVSFSSNNTLGGEGKRMRCPWRNWFPSHWLPVLEITLFVSTVMEQKSARESPEGLLG